MSVAHRVEGDDRVAWCPEHASWGAGRSVAHLMAVGENAGLSAFLTAFHIGSLECGVVNRVSTLLLATSCNSTRFRYLGT